MPVHDWTRVAAGTFHDFHQAWIVALSHALNAGLLPDGITPWPSRLPAARIPMC